MSPYQRLHTLFSRLYIRVRLQAVRLHLAGLGRELIRLTKAQAECFSVRDHIERDLADLDRRIAAAGRQRDRLEEQLAALRPLPCPPDQPWKVTP